MFRYRPNVLYVAPGDEGVPNKQDCPNGLYWNQDKKSCDLPEYVTGNCVPPTTTTTKKPTPSPTPVTSTTTTPSPFTCVNCSTGQQFFQHPTDCTKYIHCTSYGPQEMPCPEHTVWDHSILNCNYEETTPCVTGNYVDSNGNCVRPTTTTSTTTTTTTTTTKAPVTTPGGSLCDITCPAPQGLFPHPQDCKKWVHCDHNIPYVKDCPADLYFNPQLKVFISLASHTDTALYCRDLYTAH